MINDIPFLRTHSYFGFLESLISPEELVRFGVINGIRTLGLTDHRYLTGALDFYEACQSAGIKPIVGLEIDLVYRGYTGILTFLAKDRRGWSNLSRLSSLMLVENRPLTMNDIRENHTGLFCVAGDQRGLLRELLLKSPTSLNFPDSYLLDLKSIFQDNFFLEIQRYPDGPLRNENVLIDLANYHQLRIIATQNIFYGEPGERPHLQTLSAIRQNTSLEQVKKEGYSFKQSHFPSIEEFSHRFRDIPEAVENLAIINKNCNYSGK